MAALLSAALPAASAGVALPKAPTLTAELDYLVEALDADTAQREALWQAITSDQVPNDDERHQLRRALLQSVPGHSGYAPGVAHRELAQLRNRSDYPGVAALAAIRMSALQAHWACDEQMALLKDRVAELEDNLARIADIERQLETDDD